MHSITVVTATLNSAKHLPRLIDSLRNQTDSNFKWVVQDGGSTDNTLDLLNAVKGLNLLFKSSIDFGVYDALNKALCNVFGGYYLVLGSDDFIYPETIELFRAAVQNNIDVDFVAAGIQHGSRAIMPREGLGWLYGISGEAAGHAVGLMIRRDLHSKYGYYSNRFPIAADQFFFKKCLVDRPKIIRENFVAGVFSTQGLSSKDSIGALTEFFRVQIETERRVFVQYLIFLYRLGFQCLRAVLGRK